MFLKGSSRLPRTSPGRALGAIGNHLRHAYDRVDAKILWDINVKGQVLELRTVVIEFIRAMEAGERAD